MVCVPPLNLQCHFERVRGWSNETTPGTAFSGCSGSVTGYTKKAEADTFPTRTLPSSIYSLEYIRYNYRR